MEHHPTVAAVDCSSKPQEELGALLQGRPYKRSELHPPQPRSNCPGTGCELLANPSNLSVTRRKSKPASEVRVTNLERGYANNSAEIRGIKGQIKGQWVGGVREPRGHIW